jgi:hypothetical protein
LASPCNILAVRFISGVPIQNFDYTHDPSVKEFTCAAFNPCGESCVVGNFNRFFVFNHDAQRGMWEDAGSKVPLRACSGGGRAIDLARFALIQRLHLRVRGQVVENMYSVSSIAWKFDGSRLALGTVTGAVDLYDACIRRYRYKGKFEFTYVSLSQAKRPRPHQPALYCRCTEMWCLLPIGRRWRGSLGPFSLRADRPMQLPQPRALCAAGDRQALVDRHSHRTQVPLRVPSTLPQ